MMDSLVPSFAIPVAHVRRRSWIPHCGIRSNSPSARAAAIRSLIRLLAFENPETGMLPSVVSTNGLGRVMPFGMPIVLRGRVSMIATAISGRGTTCLRVEVTVVPAHPSDLGSTLTEDQSELEQRTERVAEPFELGPQLT